MFQELPGADAVPSAALPDVDRFLAALQTREADFERVLATVLFTDIVDSTAQSAALGDHRWRNVRESTIA